MRAIDMAGRRIGAWMVVELATPNRFGHRRWLCRCDCGTEKSIAQQDLSRPNSTQGCSACAGVRRRSGQPWMDDQGYVNIYMPEHPTAPSSGSVKQHRLVMEAAIGRTLTADETVHHMNGNRADNRLANLELWSSNHPAGQRVADKIEWATAFLGLYANDLLTPVDILLRSAA